MFLAILWPIGNAIKESVNFIGRSANSGNEGYSVAVVDAEAEIIESLLGVAFLVCQTNITGVVSTVINLQEFFRKNERRTPPGLDKGKSDILAQGAEFIRGSKYTDVQAINAFANYFKHRDEWLPDWTKLSKQQADTRDVISAFGAKPGFSGNLRAGAEALGNTEYSSVMLFANKLEKWRMNLKNAYQEQLKAEGVI